MDTAPESVRTKTLQYVFFPILFPFFFLLYTDVFSLLLVITAFFFALKKNYNLTAIIGIASILVRQNNIIWLLFLYIFLYFQEYSTINKEIIKNHIKKSWLFLLGFLAFAIFLFINKGIALGDEARHPGGIFFGNIYFLLFLFFFLLLPFNLANLPKIIEKIKQNKKIIPLLLAIFIFYFFTFQNTHPYNQPQYSFFLRNQILLFFTSSLFLKILFLLPIAYSILSIWATKLPSKACYLIYPTAILYLLPSWLIEQRYYLIPFALFLALKEKKSNTVEYLTIIMYITLSLYLFWGIRYVEFFL
jgi:alpha-1,2-glucosyltransferase